MQKNHKEFWQEVEKQPYQSLFKIDEILTRINFNESGLMPVVVQDVANGEILMLAWVNLEALKLSLADGTGWYFSRSRNALWHKGETSGQTQKIHSISLDCDADALLYKVEQKGVACHTGRKSCFYIDLKQDEAKINSEIQIQPTQLYKN